MVKSKSKTTAKAKKSAILSRQVQTHKNPGANKIFPQFSYKITIAIVVILFLIGLLYYKRSWLIAATVNGRPIWRWQFNQALESQYGDQALNQLINEKLIWQKAQEEGISISQERVDQEVEQIESDLGGNDSFQEILVSQNISLKELRNEIEKQLMLEDLLSQGIEISQEEVDQYLLENKDSLSAEDEAGKIDEASEALKVEKMNEKFQTWYQDLRNEAKITSFLN